MIRKGGSTLADQAEVKIAMATEQTASPPGRELDAWIAEHIMGWRYVWQHYQWNYVTGRSVWFEPGTNEKEYMWTGVPSGRKGHGSDQEDKWELGKDHCRVPNFSTKLADAWLIVKLMQGKEWDVHLDYDAAAKMWYAELSQLPGNGVFAADAVTIEHAICLAVKAMVKGWSKASDREEPTP